MEWIAAGMWGLTAVLGANLALRAGVVDDLQDRERRRKARTRFVVLGVHLAAAVGGLSLWVGVAVRGTDGDGVVTLGAIALGLLLVAGSHGLWLVERWVPGHGRHATPRPVRRGEHFPVHAASAHAMAAAATITLVAVAIYEIVTG